jgi:putative DNA primase/helicase
VLAGPRRSDERDELLKTRRRSARPTTFQSFARNADSTVSYSRRKPRGRPSSPDEALAPSFAQHHENDLRYTAAWGRWFASDGARWRFDETLHDFDLVRRTCRAPNVTTRTPRPLASAKTVAAVERLATTDRRLAATIDQWDADPWPLNTPDRTIHLRSGRLRPHNPLDYATKVTAVGPTGDCPRFLAYLDRACGGDAELVAYLRRVSAMP